MNTSFKVSIFLDALSIVCSNTLSMERSGHIEVKNGNGRLAIGASGILGGEFFVYPELSMSAEYQLNIISYNSYLDATVKSLNQPDHTEKRGSNIQILGFGSAGATLHLYF